MGDIYAESISTLLADYCTGDRLRSLRKNEGVEDTWAALVESGFLDALLPEAAGGAGLSLRDCLGVLMAAGYHALPLPFVDTIVLRAVLGCPQLAGGAPVVLAHRQEGNTMVRLPRPEVRGVRHVLVVEDIGCQLHTTAERDGDTRRLLLKSVEDSFDVQVDFNLVGSFIELAQMAGSMKRLLEMTVGYANERVQFGRPIGKFQAIQQQLAIMAEKCHAAVMAAHVAASHASVVDGRLILDESRVAAGRVVVCEASQLVCDIAHAVFGAIGMTEEHDLYLWTQRLHSGRRCYGAESYWAYRLGENILASDKGVYDYAREQLVI